MNSSLHVVESGPLPYLLSIPRGAWPEAGMWPVLCHLHGRDEGPPTALRDGLTRHGPLRPGSGAAGSDRFLVVAPQLPVRGDLWAGHAEAIRETARQVQALHGGDPARTYLAGFSYGANGVLDVALLHPDVWAALWPVDPTRVPSADPGLPVWLSAGELSRGATAEFVRRLRLQPAGEGTPPDRVLVDDGADHVGTATRAYRDARIYDWLLARRAG
jgi:poly(3-hydroxybutyrate) depolymerase